MVLSNEHGACEGTLPLAFYSIHRRLRAESKVDTRVIHVDSSNKGEPSGGFLIAIAFILIALILWWIAFG